MVFINQMDQIFVIKNNKNLIYLTKGKNLGFKYIKY